MLSTLKKRIQPKPSRKGPVLKAARDAIMAVKRQIAERVMKSAHFRAEEVSAAVAMNRAWHEVIQSELRSFIHENVFNFRSKRLLSSYMSANALTGELWDGLSQEAWNRCESSVYTLLGRGYSKGYQHMAEYARRGAGVVREESMLRTVNTMHEHSEYYFRTYLGRIAGPEIEQVTRWMDANPDAIRSPAGAKKINQLNRAIRARDYHNTISSVHVNRTYNFAALDWMTDNNVEQYAIQEILDNRTCNVCIIMHGRTYKVEPAVLLKDEFLETGHPLEARNVIPFPNLKDLVNMRETEIVGLQGPQPPFHPGCRGRLIPK